MEHHNIIQILHSGFGPKDNPNLQTTSPAWIPKAVLRMELFDQCDSRIFASSAVTIDGSGLKKWKKLNESGEKSEFLWF